MSGTLPIRQVEKPWGRDELPAPFIAPDGQRIGEIWFEPPAELPALLVKYIFTSEKLSVQVHPNDAQTLAKGIGRQGKEECWLILATEPGATLGIGFHEDLSEDELRTAALDGSIEDLMVWHEVAPGDFFYIPANTVHAIGAGVSLIEVQQNSDITYRLFDYGRPRELHLEEGMAVARGEPYAMKWSRKVAPDRSQVLVDGPLFLLDQVAGRPDDAMADRYPGALLVIPREGTVTVSGQPVSPGECALAPTFDAIGFAQDSVCLLARGCAD
ncbi:MULTISPECIES: class I mannose-6-phosphate isomerase [Novosphingobium]|uniref:Mannose-6-phosphate isomerase n=1 Tax=Novosphingobium pentaromativorans US6-1 TaxID=1088721 RepID=G6E8Z7_9SPHN|nr:MULTISPECIES: class I mannose-6-phosphate isomerase [Novosphingobium]AIT81177.1 mannose-6-phosphate isomerase [Novosphingobium pentaromativorans US6-1]EHJ62221.1 mannose-6-phosphate isomerase [Novosphingobium pentaromativorans US6-1]CCA92697.1 mannose-6-phosphate isomerase [Novosphingobium sp. PP1Y]